MTTLHERHLEQRGPGSRSRARWLLILGLVAAVIVGIVLVVLLTGGGGGSGGGGGY